MTAPYFEMMSRTVASGRLFTEQDVITNARVAVLGQSTVETLFPDGSSPLNETIRIRGVAFRVIGVLQKAGGSSSGGFDQDDLIVIPLTTAQLHLHAERNVSAQMTVSQIYLQAADVKSIDGIMQNVTTLLNQQHKIKTGKDPDFRVSSQQDMLENMQSTISTLTIFLALIGGISLVVGGIGVMNIMIVTVTERTREIGLRKAVGARGLDVLLQFLTEAVLLCFVGGFIGIALSFGITQVLRILITELQPAVSAQSIVLAVAVTTIVGVFFGLYPASRAAALSPIQALRAE